MYRKILIHILLFFIAVMSGYCQSNMSAILKGYKNAIDTAAPYKVNVVYKMYEGVNYATLKDTEKGVVYNNGAEVCMKFANVETINKPTINIKINHEEKAILVADGLSKPDNFKFNLEELLIYLDVSLVKEHQNYWYLKFMPKGELTQIPFTALEVLLQKGTYRVLKQDFFYGSMNLDASKKREGGMKLEVTYTNYEKIFNGTISKIFSVKNYLLMGNTVKPVQSFKNYELLDLRTKNKE